LDSDEKTRPRTSDYRETLIHKALGMRQHVAPRRPLRGRHGRELRRDERAAEHHQFVGWRIGRPAEQERAEHQERSHLSPFEIAVPAAGSAKV
jgi:hypothetical protein